MAQIEVRGAKLYYREAGSGAPLLLIHGTGAHADNFKAVVDPLAEHYRVIAYDRRGYSRSVAPPHPRKSHYAHHADDAAALLHALGAAPAAVLGWSAGGLIALELALRHPALVSGVVVYEPPFHALSHINWPLWKMLGTNLALRALGRKRAAATAFFRGVLAHPDGTNAWDSLSEDARESVLVNADVLQVELFSGADRELTFERLREIRCPIAAIIGMRSSPFLVAASERLARGIPKLQLVRVPDGDHLMIREKPAEFARLVHEALAGALPAPWPAERAHA